MMLLKATDDTQKKFENWGDSETIIIYIAILTGLFKLFSETSENWRKWMHSATKSIKSKFYFYLQLDKKLVMT